METQVNVTVAEIMRRTESGSLKWSDVGYRNRCSPGEVFAYNPKSDHSLTIYLRPFTCDISSVLYIKNPPGATVGVLRLSRDERKALQNAIAANVQRQFAEKQRVAEEKILA